MQYELLPHVVDDYDLKKAGDAAKQPMTRSGAKPAVQAAAGDARGGAFQATQALLQ